MSLVCMSVTIKIYGMFISKQTQHEIQITAGSGSMNESLIDTVGCLRSIAVCLCFPLFHNVQYIYVFAVFETSQSGMIILIS